MSRVGKLPVSVPKGVEVKIAGTAVSVKGPKGALNLETRGHVEVKLDNAQVHVHRFNDSNQGRAWHGLYQRLISNMIKGVTDGFAKNLEIQGIGYKAAMDGKVLVLNLGFSHQVRFDVPEGIKVTVPQPTAIIVEGADKQLVGQTAANIRSLRPPEPYGGKGIRYAGERVVLKEGKKSAK